MEKSLENRAIALAATFQACKLVNDLAFRGDADQWAERPLIRSIFDNDARTIEEIYDGLKGIKPGLELVIGLLNNPGKGNATINITRYSVGLMHLERRLRKSPQTGARMIQDIGNVERQIKFFGDMLNPAVISQLAEIYSQYISHMTPRIIVKGEQAHLENPEVAARIRALLLAGIRSAVLWRQAGGSRVTLLLSRARLVDAAQRLRRAND